MSAEAENKYKIMWGARVLTPVDVPDDILKYSITLVRDKLQSIGDNFDKGGLAVVQSIKKDLDTKWGGAWHVIIGTAFGSYATHEAKRFMYFYINDIAVMLYKA